MTTQTLRGATIRRFPQRFVFSNLGTPEKIVDLAVNQGWGVQGKPCRQTLSCLQGSVWVTQEGDIHDYVLEEGEVFLITLPGLVLVRALKPARIAYGQPLTPVSLH